MKLLRWLVLARRPLKWREIQVLTSINLHARRVDFERQMFRVTSAKDICGSLVDVREDGTVELIHLTAKQYGAIPLHVVEYFWLTFCSAFSLTSALSTHYAMI